MTATEWQLKAAACVCWKLQKHAVAALHPGRRQSVVLMMVDAGKQLGAIGRQSSAPAATDNDKV